MTVSVTFFFTSRNVIHHETTNLVGFTVFLFFFTLPYEILNDHIGSRFERKCVSRLKQFSFHSLIVKKREKKKIVTQNGIRPPVSVPIACLCIACRE